METKVKTIAELEQLLKSVLKGQFSSLTIGCNEENAPDYATVAEAIERNPDLPDWVSDEERAKAIETNTWWYAHVYPNTPVGFTRFDASSLSAVIAAIEAEWGPR